MIKSKNPILLESHQSIPKKNLISYLPTIGESVRTIEYSDWKEYELDREVLYMSIGVMKD